MRIFLFGKRKLAVLIAIALCSLSVSAMEQAGAGSNSAAPVAALDLSILRQQAVESNPYGAEFSYAKEFKQLNLQSVKQDIAKVLTTSQPWWPADYGTYGPFFIRMAWHSAGVYRLFDGRGGASGGQQRFDPLNSWADNVNLDKARRLLWPVKKKYGRALSWGDLMVLAGNVSLEQMGFKTYGFGGGREDDWEPVKMDWGPEKKALADERHDQSGTLKKPYAATQMGLIYVNPEGPNGNPDPLLAAKEIRETFARMGMNDEETVALIAGGHTFGKAHGKHKPETCVKAPPSEATLQEQGLGWNNVCGTGKGVDTVSSGLEGAWTTNPTKWTHEYFALLYAFDWEKTTSPAGAIQWKPKNGLGANTVPDAHDPGIKHAPMMFTTDLALKLDPAYHAISKNFMDNPKAYELAFAKAWFKLTHRDMGPKVRYLGADVPAGDLIWQDPLPERDYQLADANDIQNLKARILQAGIPTKDLIKAAWASAASFRATDRRGGADGARVRLLPQREWQVNDPTALAAVITQLESIKNQFDKDQSKSGKKISLADMIVLGGTVAIEQSAKAAGTQVQVPFRQGRVDADQSQTDLTSFAALKPTADGFRNYYSQENTKSPVAMLIDKASTLNLSVPEMTVLVGGLRALDANTNGAKTGVLTTRAGMLTNDFFVNLLDMSTKWVPAAGMADVYEGYDLNSKKVKWTASSVDLIFASNPELRAVVEVYAADDAKEKFVRDFVSAWTKVMNEDSFGRF
ncbi:MULTISPECIES: catalase/peroxidase HPI [unclassified Undibacterium]|uniref:catalase/peroxidase HPI n=1 Tax=unclassified Undibacterium TaxID=2630295 RepID=UPI002AC9A2FA|nr:MULTISPECIES: catalase/peroxidase HPI [unclassified Undibacterium]MEB0138509.1 catalase/peroxidase HPI [Undibacterium sp. CCC2.1]MEB0173090.1 catalase/peroxidase HPI [Undibacterium sp. CCC1.1]MEB0176142.1 catalase/peroxidase HPI [Undibacterium sp. CCC3.4]MEB0215408.1 catalase/peroxidase HPI [Undibacterium sp. 5I2]WPX42749.1 catalase/peroxidase HPI [Undibacterium sp. CCC3.4]